MNRLHRKGAWRFAVAALMLSAVMSYAQSSPKIWLWNKGNNSFSADLSPTRDNRFREAIHYHMRWGTFSPVATGVPALAVRSGVETGKRVAQERVARNLTSAETLVFLSTFGTRGIETKMDTTTRAYTEWVTYPNDEGDSVYPSLYTQPEAMMNVTYSPTLTRSERTVWTRTGIAKMFAWMGKFVNSYDTITNVKPSRILFDQEIPINIGGFNWPEVKEYWEQMKREDRWEEEPVPGFSGQTMEQIWTGRPVTVTDPTTQGPLPYHFKGGSAANQRWYTWFMNVFHQAYAATMNEAVYAKVAASWRDTKCGDYDSTIRLDGGIGEYGEPANAVQDGGYTGSLSQQGMRFSFYAPGTNIFLNPQVYNNANSYIWNTYRIGNTFGYPKWSNTDDTHNPGYGLLANGFHAPRGGAAGDEFWWEARSRMNRFYLDGLVRSYPGEAKHMVAWIMVPNQPWHFGAGVYYDGHTHVKPPVTREPLAATYRTLAQCRARGIEEFAVWNDTGYDVNTALGGYNRGIHPDYPDNWNKLRRAIDLVWAYNAKSFNVDPTNNLPQGLTSDQRVERVALSNLAYNDLGANTVEVTTSSTGFIRGITVFDKAVGVANPQFLNFEYEVRLNFNTSISLAVWDYSINDWRKIAEGAGSALDYDGRAYPVTSTAGKTMRIRARIAFNANYLDPNGRIKVAFTTAAAPGTGTTAPTAYFDLTQCYGSDAGLRKKGDFNGDGVVSVDDDNLFTSMYNAYFLGATNLGVALALDFNLDGVISSADLAIWQALYGDLVEREVLKDDGRQVANDLW